MHCAVRWKTTAVTAVFSVRSLRTNASGGQARLWRQATTRDDAHASPQSKHARPATAAPGRHAGLQLRTNVPRAAEYNRFAHLSDSMAWGPGMLWLTRVPAANTHREAEHPRTAFGSVRAPGHCGVGLPQGANVSRETSLPQSCRCRHRPGSEPVLVRPTPHFFRLTHGLAKQVARASSPTVTLPAGASCLDRAAVLHRPQYWLASVGPCLVLTWLKQRLFQGSRDGPRRAATASVATLSTQPVSA